jgi:hypothetical protein
MIWVIGILYKAIMHKMEFGHDYCKDFLKRNPKKFILYFSKSPTNFYLISKIGSISVN